MPVQEVVCQIPMQQEMPVYQQSYDQQQSYVIHPNFYQPVSQPIVYESPEEEGEEEMLITNE